MNNEPNNISSANKGDRNDITALLRELENEGSGYEGLENDAEFDADSADGLAQLNQHAIPQIVEQLNGNLRRQLKKKKKVKNRLPDQSFVYITVITVLLLIILSFIIVRKMHS